MAKQTTITNAITLKGVGIHTGEEVTMTFKPALANHGYAFQRIDLEGSPIIEALAQHVADTCLLYTSPSPRDRTRSRMPSSA